jgi:hypothetical protein
MPCNSDEAGSAEAEDNSSLNHKEFMGICMRSQLKKNQTPLVQIRTDRGPVRMENQNPSTHAMATIESDNPDICEALCQGIPYLTLLLCCALHCSTPLRAHPLLHPLTPCSSPSSSAPFFSFLPFFYHTDDFSPSLCMAAVPAECALHAYPRHAAHPSCTNDSHTAAATATMLTPCPIAGTLGISRGDTR